MVLSRPSYESSPELAPLGFWFPEATGLLLMAPVNGAIVAADAGNGIGLVSVAPLLFPGTQGLQDKGRFHTRHMSELPQANNGGAEDGIGPHRLWQREPEPQGEDVPFGTITLCWVLLAVEDQDETVKHSLLHAMVAFLGAITTLEFLATYSGPHVLLELDAFLSVTS
jgi:hypothetical protein